MSITKTNRDHSAIVGKQLDASKGSGGGILTSIWHWINGVASGVAHFLSGPITTVIKTYWAYLRELGNIIAKVYTAYGRIIAWIYHVVYWPLYNFINRERKRIYAKIARVERYLLGVIAVATQTVLTIAVRDVRAEERARVLAIQRQATRDARARRALHAAIEREAASGYALEHAARVALILRLLDFAALRNPLVKRLTGDIATGLLDIASIDDPIARVLFGFLIKHVIDRLGIDKAVGTLISDLAAPIIGDPKPHDIHDVIDDLSKRIGAMEGQWAKFMEDGGSQVEQAGRDWRDYTGLAFNTAIVAFVAQSAIDPKAWASEIQDTIGRPAEDLANRAVSLLGR